MPVSGSSSTRTSADVGARSLFLLRYLRRRRGPEFLVVRRRQFKTHFYEVILEWIAEHFPQYASMFRVRYLPCRVPRGSDVVLHIPWLQDPVQRWSPMRYRQANRLARQCDTLGIPIVNRVDRLINASKSVGSRLMSEAGIRTPRVVPIADKEEFRETHLGLDLPLLVRDDWRHGSEILRADSREDVYRLSIERFERPVAVELVDVGDPDGLYRKYRYVAAGDLGIAHHLQISRAWITRGDNRERTESSRESELAYIAGPDPNHKVLQRARAALGLEFLAFDYGYDRKGQMVVWEANPYPYIHFSRGRTAYRNPATDRTIAAMLAMYLRQAGMPVPEVLERRSGYEG